MSRRLRLVCLQRASARAWLRTGATSWRAWTQSASCWARCARCAQHLLPACLVVHPVDRRVSAPC